MKTIILLLFLVFFTGCSSSPKKEFKEETFDDAKLTKNESNEAILVSETTGQQELRLTIWDNSDKEKEILVKVRHINSCKEISSDPRIGGEGRYNEAEATVIKRHELKKEFDKDNFKFTTKEKYDERLAFEREYNKNLQAALDNFTKQEKDCKQTLRANLAKRKLLNIEEIDTAETNSAAHSRNLRDLASDMKEK